MTVKDFSLHSFEIGYVSGEKMVRTRSSARLASAPTVEEAPTETNHASLENLEKLERKLGRKKVKNKT